ncbi:MAG TPA: M20/M25/M40 family metallo-hydrolase [Longimicrobiales bacterium]|nr:M20/M25/M40 family metallo-hydrolase [Longimicrobiales bacterium]
MTELETCLAMSETDATDRLLRRIRDYVEHETPSGDEAALLRLAALVEEDLTGCGATVQRFDAPGLGRNLLATIPGERADDSPVVAMAHMDTVHPVGTLAERPIRREDGRVYGPGIYDMKSGLATIVEALAWLREQGRRPRRNVHVLVTCDEEIGSHSSHDLIIGQARNAAAVLVPEPCMPDGGVKTARKGVATYRVSAHGQAAHAGIDGHLAVSATAELVHALCAVLDLARHDRGTTINVGLMNGGTASNVVPAHAEAVVDVRLAEPDEGARVHGALVALRARNPKARLVIEQTESRPPLVRTDEVVALYHHARDLAAALGVDLAEGGTGGGSDGSIAASVGAAVLDGLGVQGGGAHAIDEHIVVADLPFRLALMARLLETL